MKRFVSGAVALIATGWMASVEAADIPYGSRAPYTVNQPLNIYSWAGPYLGANLGYAWGSVDHNPTKPSGFVGGGQLGYNWQTGPWASAPNSASRRAGAPRSNISTSISPTATSPLPAPRTVTGSDWCAPASTITSDTTTRNSIATSRPLSAAGIFS